MNKRRNTIIMVICAFILGGLLSFALHNVLGTQTLPKPEVADGIRGEVFGIDKNIHEETIDNYLNREDSVYRDMRMLVDPANYEAIGGDSYLSGFVEGFQVYPLPTIMPVTNLPKEVGPTYQQETLFIETEDGYLAAYEESMSYLEYHFPKDKNLFIMCGGGGYAGMMKDLLISLGWDEDKIYNVGAYWDYQGKHNIEVKNESGYDFWKVPYHPIDFNQLTKVSP